MRRLRLGDIYDSKSLYRRPRDSPKRQRDCISNIFDPFYQPHEVHLKFEFVLRICFLCAWGVYILLVLWRIPALKDLLVKLNFKYAIFEFPWLSKKSVVVDGHLSRTCECKHSELCLKCKLANYFCHLASEPVGNILLKSGRFTYWESWKHDMVLNTSWILKFLNLNASACRTEIKWKDLKFTGN